jgi:hypothetical protein
MESPQPSLGVFVFTLFVGERQMFMDSGKGKHLAFVGQM